MAFYDKMSGQVACNLEDGNWSFLHEAPDAHTDTWFEVRVVFISLHHVEWDSAVGEDHLTRFWVDARRIGLETWDAK